MHLRRAIEADVPLIAAMNGRLLEDESHGLRLTAAELEKRMHGWLAAEYQAVLFIDGSAPIGYALFRPDEHGIYLRQFYVERGRRRRGIGRKAIELLRQEIWPAGAQVTLEVLVGNQPAQAFWRAVGFTDYAVTMRWARNGLIPSTVCRERPPWRSARGELTSSRRLRDAKKGRSLIGIDNQNR